jgi:hypothetical protein
VAQGQTLQERQSQSLQQSYHGQSNQQRNYYDDDDSPIDMPQGLNGGGGGLRVANRASGESEDWGAEALRHMNLNDR